MQTITKKPTRKEVVISILMAKENAFKETYNGIIIITYTQNGKPVCAVYTHNTVKPSYHYNFLSEEKRNEFIAKQKVGADESVERVNRYEAERKIENDKIQVGTIMYSSWGYEQTNIDFYIVTERKNDTIIMQAIGSKCTHDGDMTGKCIADPSTTVGQPFKKRIGKYGVSLASYKSCSVWDGSPKYFSTYA